MEQSTTENSTFINSFDKTKFLFTTESGQSHLSLIFKNENVLPLESFVFTVNN